jgi:hypothetical protein
MGKPTPIRQVQFRTFLAALLAVLWLPLAGCSSGGDSGGTPGTQDKKITSVLIAADESGDIFRINPASGAITLMGGAGGAAPPPDVGPITGMAFDPGTGRMIAATGAGSTACAGCIYALDPATGRATILNDSSFSPDDIGDLAWDYAEGAAVFTYPWDGTIYGDIDPITGDVYNDGVDPGSSCCNGYGLAFANDGTLYVTTGDELYSLDPASDFAETLVGTYTYQGFPAAPSGSESLNSMTMGADGKLYAIMVDGASTSLVTVDPVPGAPVVTWQVDLPRLLDGLVALSTSALQAVPLAQFGRIGGLTFKVIEGAITQAGPDQPITSTGGPATILFDDPIASFAFPDPDKLGVTAQVVMTDGGSVATTAFGDAGNLLAGGLSSRLERAGTSIAYEFRFGGTLNDDDFGTFAPDPADPAGVLYLTGDFFNDQLPAYSSSGSGMAIWHPEDADPTDSYLNTVHAYDEAYQGDGDRLGLTFQGVTIQDVTVSDVFFFSD